jgi:hypothetical protein
MLRRHGGGVSGDGGDDVALVQGLADQFPAGRPGGSKDDDVHFRSVIEVDHRSFYRRRRVAQDLIKLYPDIAEHGSVGKLLRSICEAQKSSLNIFCGEDHGMSQYMARAERHRFCQVSIASERRRFHADFWD